MVILTGTGDRFIAESTALGRGHDPGQMVEDLLSRTAAPPRLLEIEVPVIGAVNGPATVHAELAVLSDIVLAAEHAYFSDAPHFRFGTVPADGSTWSGPCCSDPTGAGISS